MTQDRNPDHTIDRVLHALTQAAPPYGLERRILNTLDAATEGVVPSESDARRGTASPANWFAGRRRTPAFHTASSATPRWRWIPLTCAVALALVIPIIATRRHQPTTTPTVQAPPTPLTNDTSQPRIAAATITTHTPMLQPHTAPPPRLTQTNRIADSQPEATALISHPAPPLPLTEQEKLLIRFARHGNPNDLVEITAERKAAREQQEAADFTAFFAPPPPPPTIGESE
ncbi:hypothetical protein [Edaphobacter flagellatus]|uniref:hypothetical protein n=1 Tax=Edaphobacter flagellatus TaxID=1933044 RepID=UPI0021B418AA|nr:hypothetical protein [Edaphobacter flagellatus]